MTIVCIDFETYYDKDYSLSKLTTEEYINDPRFEVIGMGMKVGTGPAVWITDDDIAYVLGKFDWSKHAILCHNALFDGAILSWKYGVKPDLWLDTLSMARALHGVDVGGSLAALAKKYNLGEKGDEIVQTIGKRRADFSAEDLSRFGDYCCNDVTLTADLFDRLYEVFPKAECRLIDLTLRMFTEPSLWIDDALLNERLQAVKVEKSALLRGLMDVLDVGDEEVVRAKLASNPQFAQLLRDAGVEPPMKTSPRTGKQTYALAKNDEGFMALTEHEDPFIQQLCSVRLGTKSTLEESRIERFIGIGARNKGKLPIPLKYYGAHTGRWSGLDSVNLQNLPSRDKAKKTLKHSIIAPPGHYIINSDSSQIEARVLAWLAGQDDVVKQFANGDDVYSAFATKIYAQPITKANPTERFVGKTCLGADTRVLTKKGWVPLVQVTTKDQLWDGVEWVNHHGVSYMGLKPIINLHGLELTADHEILTDHTKWETAHYVQTHDTAFQSALNLAISSLSDISNAGLSAPAGGVKTESSFLSTFKRFKVGISRNYRWIVSTLMGTTNRAISGLYPQVKIWPTNEKSKILKPVFDILNSGSRNRFTVLTDRGPVIVHNCILGLGYGTGAAKLQHTLKTQPPGAEVTLEQAQDYVSLYRRENPHITQLWRDCEVALNYLKAWDFESREFVLGQPDCVTLCREGIRLPNGLYIRYPNLRVNNEGRNVYDSRQGEQAIWGGAMTENIVQALARIVVGQQMVWIARRYRPVLTVHDSVSVVAPEDELYAALEYVTLCMSTAPDWAKGLPIACEVKHGRDYGEC